MRQIADELRELNRRLDERGRGGYPGGYQPCTKVDLKVDRDGEVSVDGQPCERPALPGYLQQIGACEVNIIHHPSLSSDALNRLLRSVQSVPLRDVILTADETAPRVRVAVELDGRLDVGGQGHSIQSLGRHLEQKRAYHLTIVSHPKVSTGYIERLIAQAQAAGVVEFELEG